jgi:hypothetical protein
MRDQAFVDDGIGQRPLVTASLTMPAHRRPVRFQ